MKVSSIFHIQFPAKYSYSTYYEKQPNFEGLSINEGDKPFFIAVIKTIEMKQSVGIHKVNRLARESRSRPNHSRAINLHFPYQPLLLSISINYHMSDAHNDMENVKYHTFLKPEKASDSHTSNHAVSIEDCKIWESTHSSLQ